MHLHRLITSLLASAALVSCGVPTSPPYDDSKIPLVDDGKTTEQIASPGGPLNILFDVHNHVLPTEPVMISIDGRPPQAVKLPIGSVSYDVSPGTHTFKATLAQAECGISYMGKEYDKYAEAGRITVSPGVSYSMYVTVDCTRDGIPVGAYVVTEGPNPGGFSVSVISEVFGTTKTFIDVINGKQRIGLFHVGAYRLLVSDIPANCTLMGLGYIPPGSEGSDVFNIGANTISAVFMYHVKCK